MITFEKGKYNAVYRNSIHKLYILGNPLSHEKTIIYGQIHQLAKNKTLFISKNVIPTKRMKLLFTDCSNAYQ